MVLKKKKIRLQDAVQSYVCQVTQHLVFTEGVIYAYIFYVIDEILEIYQIEIFE